MGHYFLSNLRILSHNKNTRIINLRPIPVAARFKAFLRSRSLDGIAGLNPAGGMDGRLLCLLCVVQVEASANELITSSEESYRLCVCLIVCDLENSREAA